MKRSEEWRPIPGTDGVYEVSSEGQIRSHALFRGSRGPRLLKWTQGKNGYPFVNPAGMGPKNVHSLVALAFLGPTPPGMEVRHLDGDSQNPSLANLAFGTGADNQRDRVDHGTSNRGTRQHMNKLTEDDVREIRRLARETRMFKKDIGAMFGVSRTTVSSIIHGSNWAWMEDE